MAWFRRGKAHPEEQRTIDLSSLPKYTAGAILDALTVDPVNVTIDKALTVPAVWAAVSFISDTIASLPFQLFARAASDGREVAKADPLYRLLHDAPNPETTSGDFLQYLLRQALTEGRGLAYIERARNNRILALWLMDAGRCEVRKVGMRKSYRYTEDDGSVREYESREIIDIPFALKSDGLTALSPIYNQRPAIGLNIALQEYAQKLFLNGGVPPLKLEGPFDSPASVQRASQDVTAAIQMASKEGRPVLPLPVGHRLEAIGLKPEDSQFIQGRLFALQEVSRIYRLPPTFLQDMSHGTFANTEQADLQVVKHTLNHWLVRIEQQFNLKLFGQSGARFVEFNLDGLLRGDFKTRMEGYSKAVQNSINTPNEVRARENLPPMDGGDDLMIQQNMTATTALGNLNGNT